MEACDQLLKSCHAQSLNLFVESFLKMVQRLLESEEPELQILATKSVSICRQSNSSFTILGHRNPVVPVLLVLDQSLALRYQMFEKLINLQMRY